MPVIAKCYMSTVIAVTLTLLLVLSIPGNVVLPAVFAQLQSAIFPSNKPNTISSTNGNVITIQTTNVIQGSSIDLLKAQIAMLKRAVVAGISNAVLVTKGNVTSNIPVTVNAKIINQLANRASTTQGIDFTKTIVAKELTNAINMITTNINAAATTNKTAAATTITEQQIPRVVVDNQAICSGIASHTGAACYFTISIHK